MKYEILEKKNGRCDVKFSLDKKEWEQAVENAYQKERGKYGLKGFRKGKVPRSVLEKTYGEDLFFETAFEMAFPKVYGDMLKKEKDLDPIDYPQLKWDTIDEKGISFTAVITTMPEIKLGEYKGLTVEKKPVEVKDSEIKHELSHFQEKGARFVDSANPIEKGDFVTFDFEGSVDGKLFEGGSAKDFELEIGSGRFIPGFEDQMIGLKVDEVKDLQVKFPEDYHAMDLAGKDSIFKVTIHGIKKKELPKLDDEFAKDVSEFNTLDELKADIKKRLLDEKQKEADYAAENELIEKIVASTSVEVPACLIDRQLDTFVEDIKQKLAYQGYTFEDYLKFSNTTEEKYRKDHRLEAEKVVRTSIVLDEIVKQENIKVTDKEIDAKLKEIADAQQKDVEELKAHINEEQRNVLKSSVMSDKVIKTIKELNNIK